MPEWCITHERDHERCLAGEGGIMMPCEVVESEERGRAVVAERRQRRDESLASGQ